MGKRLITERQERALRLCHHDFGELTQAEAAKKMGISQPAVGKLLATAEKALPQFFPILTKFEAKCYNLYMEGHSVMEIAFAMWKSRSAVYDALQRCRDKGKFFPETKQKILSYNPSMDGNVKERF